MENVINYVQEKLRKLGAESMLEDMQMQVKLKRVGAVSALKSFLDKLDKTGNPYKVMNYFQLKFGWDFKNIPDELNIERGDHLHTQFIAIIIIGLLFLLVCFFCCKICRKKAAAKTMKAPGRKNGDRMLRSKFESNPKSYFLDLRCKKN
ncbi:unnamed protein product [Fraxinus pennsylvanica]|uniref:Uncharacterized protein n=1 Tax=Fraxinus pennsylvanica TaxID=56036 RepID=A0AAD2DUL4_9LAMI|nr:unnamed protein product [Fraxinus pennsylvanica]